MTIECASEKGNGVGSNRCVPVDVPGHAGRLFRSPRAGYPRSFTSLTRTLARGGIDRAPKHRSRIAHLLRLVHHSCHQGAVLTRVGDIPTLVGILCCRRSKETNSQFFVRPALLEAISRAVGRCGEVRK